MASRSDIEAGKAVVILGVNVSPLIKGLKSVQDKMSSWGKNIMGAGAGIFALGAGITTAFAGAVGVFTSMGGELADLSAKTSVSASELAALGYAAVQSGTDLDTVGKALINMQKKGLDPKHFDAIAAKIAAIPDDAERVQAAMEVWGKAGAELLPMLGDLQKLKKEARDLNLIPSEEAVASAALIGDKIDQIKAQVMAGIFEIGAALAPVLLPIIEGIIQVGKGVITWVRNNAALVRMIAMIGVGLMAAGAIVMAIGASFIAIGAVIGSIATILGAIGPILAVAFSPLGLILAGVIAIGVAIVAGIRYWLLFTDSGKKTMAAIMGGIKGIVDALMSGNIGLAGQIAATTLKVAFFEAIGAILDMILLIPRAMIQAMAPLVAWDPTGQLQGLLTGAEAMLNQIASLSGTSAEDARKELAELNKQAAKGRAEQERLKDIPGPDHVPQRDGQGKNAPAFEKLKSLGSFNAQQLVMQNWGAGGKKEDEAKKGNKFLEKLLKELETNTKETKNNKVAWA